jgi:nucleoside-diphosphate kinase
MTEQTLSIIKPDGVQNNYIGKIVYRFEEAGLRIAAMRMIHLDAEKAGEFYAEHKARPFFKDLVSFISSGPIVVMVLEGENAIAKNRDIMGATNPKEAKAGTIRADLADSIDANTVHGSDSAKSAEREIAFFFAKDQVHARG